MNILIVDDHEENRYLLESLLKGNGYHTIFASNGAEAMDIIKKGGIDMIISDILMPVMDGFQLLRKVKTDEKLRIIPFIIYTATYTSAQDEEFALKIGADRFIEKPCEPDVFINAVNGLMEEYRKHGGSLAKPSVHEEEALKLYSERLVKKLEQKVLEVENQMKERLEAEEALRESESRFRLFADTAPVGVIITNKEGVGIYASKKFTSMFGYTLDDTPDVEAWQSNAFPDEEIRMHFRQEWLEMVKKARTAGSDIKPMEYPVRCRDGTVKEIEFRMSTSGGFDFIVFTDITERKRAEEEQERLHAQLTHAQKMESVGRLAGGIAHDFNNILQSMLGYNEMLLNELPEDNKAHEFSVDIMHCIDRASALTRQLLAFARKQAVEPHIIDMNETVEGMLKMLRRLISEDIDIVWLPKSGLWHVNMDPTQLDQILVNLCVNASDAIEGVGMLTIETGMLSFDEDYCREHSGYLQGDFVMLAVSDDGCGMDEETLKKLFEPFYTTKDVGKGTGLGLATVYGIVKQNNGFIDVKSEPGKGSVFRVYLPRYDGNLEDACEEEDEDIALGNGETILLVEDEDEILRISKAILEQLGYKVFTARSAGEALKLANEITDNLDLLITDVIMPEMNGRELGSKMIKIHPDIKLLFMSGYSPDVVADQGVAGASVPFIQKPFTIRDISVKVSHLLKGK